MFIKVWSWTLYYQTLDICVLDSKTTLLYFLLWAHATVVHVLCDGMPPFFGKHLKVFWKRSENAEWSWTHQSTTICAPPTLEMNQLKSSGWLLYDFPNTYRKLTDKIRSKIHAIDYRLSWEDLWKIAMDIEQSEKSKWQYDKYYLLSVFYLHVAKC
jgi:hypothetical protein